jgi:chorismate mutase/prephenate dehydratase
MHTIAYLGPEKTNTHLAAQATFGRRSRYLHAPTVEDVFRLVEREEADLGVVPIENSLEGAVTHTLDRFIDFKQSPIRIHGEIEQPIRHSLIVHRGTSLSGVNIVYSHPQALAQCNRWLAKHLPQVERRETNSTAEAVEYLLSARLWLKHSPLRARAAIAREDLAKAHGLRAIPIPQDAENKTRFLVIGLGKPRRGRRNKTSVLFALKDQPGALHDALVPFKRHRINLTKIESRPSKRKAWEYLFFIDFEGHESERRVQRALKALERHTALLRVLGSYPTAK